MPTNFGDGGVLDTTRRFQTASPAFISPACRPTRGSGLGAEADMLPAGAGALDIEDDVGCVQAAVSSSPIASGSDRSEVAVAHTTDRRAWSTDAIASTSDGAA